MDFTKLNTELLALSPSKRSAAKTLYVAFHFLAASDGGLARRELLEKMAKVIEFEAWELERYPSNGQLKWLTIFLFYTIDAIKAGWLVKNKGFWHLTETGLTASNFSAIKLLEQAGKGYREWQAGSDTAVSPKDDVDIKDEQIQAATLESLQEQASEAIGKYLESIHFEKFQQICSALLKSMNLHIDFEATKGPDGGIDLIAFKDELGFEKPRIKIQIKNYNAANKVDVKDIRELKGLLNASEHIGLFITSGYFTAKAREFARASDIHIKLIDRDSFIELWQQNYSKLTESEKMLLPLKPIYFLGQME